MNDDPFDLARFLPAQAGDYETARRELSRGRKISHWMWYVFPQLKGLGSSAMSTHYGIGSLAEARAYLAHPLLGPRLAEATQLVLRIEGRSLEGIFGSPDDRKFRSSMTLFAHAAGPGSIYEEALNKLCGGKPDEKTLALLGRI